MEQTIECNIVNTLYYLYFYNRELIYHSEIIWSEDGMNSEDEEYSYIFCGIGIPNFTVNLEAYYFLRNNNIIEKSAGNEHEDIFLLSYYYRVKLAMILKNKFKEQKAVAK